MKIFVESNILIKGRICTDKILQNFKPPYSATVVEKIKAAGHEITDNKNEADAVICPEAYTDYMFHIRPTYGTVSRFGLVANASSMDQIGVSAHEIDTAFFVLSLIAGYDKNDGTTYPAEKYDYAPAAGELKTINFNNLDFKSKEYLIEVYQIISAAEFSGNISRFDGLKYGYRADDFKDGNDITINSRSGGLAADEKLRALLGAYVLSEGQFEKYYVKATKIRRLIKQKFDEIFKQYDIIRAPDMIPAYLTGCPALATPKGEVFIAQNHKEGCFYGI